MADLILLTGEQERYDCALEYAKLAHGSQVRKYTGEPYWHHLVNVAALVSQTRNRSIEMIEAALLHDVLEDTDTTAYQLEGEFGMLVRAYVEALTDPPFVKGRTEPRSTKADCVRPNANGTVGSEDD